MRHSIEIMSRPIGRSSSVRNPSTQKNLSASTLQQETEHFDTALPPMSLVATRRPHNGQPRLPYPQNLTSVQGGVNAHRRTGSTLKTVMKKFFTRNRRSRSDDMDDPMSDFHYRNNSTSAPNNPQKSPNPSKSGSSQQSKRNQNRPAAETLTTLDVVLKQLDTEPRQRRATLPSLIFSDDGSRHALETVLHPGKKPSNRKLSPHANSDPDEVRRRKMRNTKRRSRSAGALRVLANEHRMSPIQWKRRRSVESDRVTSTAYSAASDSDSSRPPTPSTVASAPKPTEVSVFEEDEPDQPDAPSLLSPGLPPNVGELISSMQSDDNASLGQRMTTLEVKLIDLEFAIARMQSGRTETTAASSPNQKSLRHDRKKSKSSGYSYSSSREVSPTEPQLPESDRPLSTATIRPSLTDVHRARALQAPSMVSLSSESSAISVQQYSALVMLLRREQTARRNLEQQVSGLREDIERLTQVARDSVGIGTGTMYPIRSFESQEYLRLRPDDSLPASSPRQTSRQAEEKATRYKRDSSESDWGRERELEKKRERERERDSAPKRSGSDMRSKDEKFRPWQATRRVEVAHMI